MKIKARFHETTYNGLQGSTLRYEKTNITEHGDEVDETLLKVFIDDKKFVFTERLIFEMLEHLTGRINGVGVPLKWDKIDTTAVKNTKDEILLELVKDSKVLAGWGLIAEIIKRYSRRVETGGMYGDK